MTILVTGATGNVSGALLRLLADGSEPVRALVRDPSKWAGPASVEMVQGDLDVPSSLPTAFEGVDTLWLLNAMDRRRLTPA